MADLTDPYFEVEYTRIQPDGSEKELTCKFLTDSLDEEEVKASFEQIFSHTARKATVKKLTLISHG